MAVPADALYGVQTQRAVNNFPLRGQHTIGRFQPLVLGLIYVKQAATIANLKAGQIDKSIAKAILEAARNVLDERRYDQFPIHYLHGGGGTSANMNANEVLANIGEELLGGKRGEYRLIHPNDHVNLNQSTNDVYPTACHVAVILQWPMLKESLDALVNCLNEKAKQLHSQQRIARTCLQDAVAICFGDMLGGYIGFMKRNIRRIDLAVDQLHAVCLGGNIVGLTSEVPPAYFDAVVPALCKVSGDCRYRRCENHFDAAQNLDDMVCISADMDLLSRGLVKICQDLRLMNSGPETGFGEVTLPAVQPGSSIMPGKINPVIPEHAIQLCFKIMGNHACCQATLDHGELDLNIWESTVVFSVLESMELLKSAADALSNNCIADLQVDEKRNDRNVKTIMPLLTTLMKRYGYSRVCKICKEAGSDVDKLRDLLAWAFPDVR